LKIITLVLIYLKQVTVRFSHVFLQGKTKENKAKMSAKRPRTVDDIFHECPDDLNLLTMDLLRPIARKLAFPPEVTLARKEALVKALDDARYVLQSSDSESSDSESNRSSAKSPSVTPSVISLPGAPPHFESSPSKHLQSDDEEKGIDDPELDRGTSVLPPQSAKLSSVGSPARAASLCAPPSTVKNNSNAVSLPVEFVDPESNGWLTAAQLLCGRKYGKKLYLSWANAAVLLDPFAWAALLEREEKPIEALRSGAGTRTQLNREIRDNLSELAKCTSNDLEMLMPLMEEIALVVGASKSCSPFEVITRHRARFERALEACAAVEARGLRLLDGVMAKQVVTKQALSTLPLSDSTRELAEKAKVSLKDQKDHDDPKDPKKCKYCSAPVKGSIIKHFKQCEAAKKAYAARPKN